MSGEEKIAQIGEAVTEYRDAKIACSHIELKSKKVFALYLSAGNSMDEQSGRCFEPTIAPEGKLKLGLFVHPGPYPELLNEAELTALVAERDEAQKRLKDKQAILESLGMSGIQ